MTATRALFVGECLVELRHDGPDTLRVSYAGDTYDAAVYPRRTATELGLAGAAPKVGYLTGLGADD